MRKITHKSPTQTLTRPEESRQAAENNLFKGINGSGGGTRTPDTRIMIPLL